MPKNVVVDSKVKEWVTSRQLVSPVLPKVKFEGEVFDWINPHIYVSEVPGLDYCTYQQGLTAKMFKETGKLPVPSQESIVLMEGGKVGHEEVGKRLEIPPEVDFTLPEVKKSPSSPIKELLTREEACTIEFPISRIYKDILLRGRLDYISFNKGSPKTIEEWKFTKNGKVKDSHKTQVRIYAYLIHKWLGYMDFNYVIKAWPWGSWSKEDQIEVVDSGLEGTKPSDVFSGLFTEGALKAAELSLDRANSFFTGKVECIEDSGTCKWCPYGKEECKYYLEDLWASGTSTITKLPSGEESIIVEFSTPK